MTGSNSGSVALVTGGCSPIGFAIAEALAGHGFAVVVTSQDLSRAEECARLIDPLGERCVGLQCDVRDDESIDRTFVAASARFGDVSTVIANAGGSLPTADFPYDDLDQSLDVFEVNVAGAYRCARRGARDMLDRGQSGLILFIGSIFGVRASDPLLYQGVPDFAPSGPSYHAAKAALIQLTRSLAVRLGPSGIRVNCVSPGIVPTNPFPKALEERVVLRTPLRRIGKPSDVAGIVAFLASDSAAWITGQNFIVDGGWSAQ